MLLRRHTTVHLKASSECHVLFNGECGFLQEGLGSTAKLGGFRNSASSVPGSGPLLLFDRCCALQLSIEA